MFDYSGNGCFMQITAKHGGLMSIAKQIVRHAVQRLMPLLLLSLPCRSLAQTDLYGSGLFGINAGTL